MTSIWLLSNIECSSLGPDTMTRSPGHFMRLITGVLIDSTSQGPANRWHQLPAVCVNEPSDALFSRLWIYQLRLRHYGAEARHLHGVLIECLITKFVKIINGCLSLNFIIIITRIASEVCIFGFILCIIIIDICYQFHRLFYASPLRMCQGACEDYNFKYKTDVLATWRNACLSYCPH